MNQLPEPPTPVSPYREYPERGRVIHVSIRPKSWLGKIAFAIAGLVLLVVGVLFSLVVLAIVAGVGVLGALYFLWATRHVRRALREARKQQQEREIRDVDAREIPDIEER